MNRYTNISTSQYNPLSLQELMVAPSYLRKKHDDTEAAYAEYQSKLANVDPLSIHSDIATQKQQELENELQLYSDDLATNGFSNTSKSNLLNFNKKYQSEISPTGTLGQINSAKAQYLAEKKAFMDNAIKMKQSPDNALRNWEAHSKKYNDSFDGKTITNIDSLYAPKYYDYLTKAQELFSKAGVTMSDTLNGRGDIVFDPKKGSYVVNTKTKKVSSSNKEQLESAANFMNNLVTNPNSDAHKSLLFEGKTPESVMNELKGMDDIFIKSKTGGGTVRTLNSFNPLETPDDKSNNISGGLTHTNNTHQHFKYSKESYSSLKSKLDNNKLGDNEKGMLNGYIKNMEYKLHNNQEYKNINKNIKAEQDILNVMSSDTYNWNTNKAYSQVLKANKNNMTDSFSQRIKSEIIQGQKNKITHLNNKIDDIAKPFQDDLQLTSTNFTITPVNAKERSIEQHVNKSIGKIFTSTPRALMDNAIISGIQTIDGQHNVYSDDDLKGISKLLHTAGSNAVELIDFTARGMNGLPSYKLRINTKKGNTYNLDGWGTHEGDIGNGEPVTITLSFKDNKIGAGSNEIRNVNGLVQDYIRLAGGKKGVRLANSMNDTISLSNNTIRNKYAGQKWSNLLKKGIVGLNYEQNLLFKQALTRELGVDLKSLPEAEGRRRVAEATKKLLKQTIQ